MATPILSNQDYLSASRIVNLPNPTSAQEPATKSYVDSAVEGLNWKASVWVATQGNINLASPGNMIDGEFVFNGYRILVKSQINLWENGIYVIDSPTTPMIRALDANIYEELVQAVVTVEVGTSKGISYRQNRANGGLLDIQNEDGEIVFEPFGTVAPVATETQSGTAEIATQAEVDAGTDDTRFITPLKLASASSATKRLSTTIGDGSSTLYTITHNFNTYDVNVTVYQSTGNRANVIVDIQRPSVNSIAISFASAPLVNAYTVSILA